MGFNKLPSLRYSEIIHNRIYIEWIYYKDNKYNVKASCYFTKDSSSISNVYHTNNLNTEEEFIDFCASIIRKLKLKNVRNIHWKIPDEYLNAFINFLNGYGFKLDDSVVRNNNVFTFRRRRNGN